MAAARNSLEHLRCPVCKDYAQSAVETECCAQIFCSPCLNGKLQCPRCETNGFKFRKNLTARKVIAEIEEPCVNGCMELISRLDLKSHIETCKLRIYHCPKDGCSFSSMEDNFLVHMTESHKKLVLERLTSLPVPPVAADTNIGQFINRDGNVATMGQNAKFYCNVGQVLKRKRTSDMTMTVELGHCGPATMRGSNCNACMALDIQFRGLGQGLLVNTDGIVSRAVQCIHVQPPNAAQRRRSSGLNASIKPCSRETCGSLPIYYCDRPYLSFRGETRKLQEKCEAMNRCTACDILRLQVENGAYADVW